MQILSFVDKKELQVNIRNANGFKRIIEGIVRVC